MALGTKVDANIDRLMNEQMIKRKAGLKTGHYVVLLIKADMATKNKRYYFLHAVSFDCRRLTYIHSHIRINLINLKVLKTTAARDILILLVFFRKNKA